MVIDIVDSGNVQRHIPRRFEGRAVVVQRRGLTGGLIITIECAADGHQPVAVDQCVIAVIDGSRADIQPLPCRNSRCLPILRQVVQRAGANGQRVPVNAPAADITDGLSVDAGVKTVNKPVVGDRLRRIHLRGACVDFCRRAIEDVVCRQG